MTEIPIEIEGALSHMTNPAIWVIDNQFINENQKPFEFNAHRFMLLPYGDCSPDQAIMKSAQVGWSVAAILKSIHAAKFLKLNVIYVLPTRNVVHDFVTPKVNPMIRRNPVIAEMVKGSDSTSLKQVGDRFIYFRGSFHEGEAISITADLVVADEYDRSDQSVLTVYQSRLQASDYGWFWRFSNPSVPGFGVHEYYQDSDQMHWIITCPYCKNARWIDIEHDKYTNNHYLNEGRTISPTPYYACGACHKQLPDAARQAGTWMPKFPERSRRGYWINQLMVPWVPASKILQQRKEMDIATFHNFVLGKPYQASEYLINRESILRTTKPGLADKTDVIIGCDSGKTKHWVMGNTEGIFSYGKYDSWDEVERLRNLYDATMVIDALPDFTVPERLARKYPGKVFVHYYTHDSKMMEVSIRNEGVNYGRIDSDRTKLFDLLAAEVTSGQVRFFLEPKALDELIYHFEQIYRIVEADPKGIERAKWETKENRPDHFAHAVAYWRVGRSFLIKAGETGGVTPGKAVKPKGYFVDGRTSTAKVKDVLDIDAIVERSIGKAKKRRVE